MALSEIPIVSAARHQQNRGDSPRAVSVITAKEIRRRNFRNIPEAVAGLTGVFLQQTNYAGGSPIIRGMVGNRLLLMLNGIRLNNATFRLGPNQYLNFIDIHQVERIEIVRGTGSVLYGSDAFGGVINIITKAAPDPRLGQEFGGRLQVRYGSADQSGSGHVEFSGSSHGLGFLGGVTREGFGDLRVGRGGMEPYSAYSQWSGDVELQYALGPERTLSAGLMRLRQSGVERSDLLKSGSDLAYEWNPEGRDLAYVQYAQSKVNRYIDALQITTAYQRPIEYLTRIVASDPNTRRYHEDEVMSGNLMVQFTSSLRSSQLLTYGLEVNSDQVTSRRTDVQLATGVARAARGNYPDGSGFRTISLFVQDEVDFSKRLHGVFGARQDWFRIAAELADTVVGKVKVDSAPGALTGSAYWLYDLTPKLSAVFGIAQGFRAPNLDDSTIVGGSGGRYEIPNPSLTPERSTNFEYGLRVKAKRGKASVVYFDDHYRGLMDRAPALLNGLPFVDSNGNKVKDPKEMDVYQRQNIGRASVRGVEAEGMMTPSPGWTWTSTATWTHGSDDSLSAPLSRIPPLQGESRITWQPGRNFWVEGVGLAATDQHRISPGDRADVRIGPSGTAGFAVFHIRAGISRTVLAGASIAWENLTNRRYRLHGSGIDRPGMGVVVGYTRAF
ncbi:MAG: TonB-dependent receptor [Bryobacteraceae bacterium]